MNALRLELEGSGAQLVVAGDGFRVLPSSIAALGRAVAVLRGRKLAVAVRGNGDAPSAPPAGGALLDLSALDRIASVDAATGVVRVEAGCSVASLEAAARRAGATLGPLLPGVRSGSVGAWLGGPTRGERGIPGARRETAALSVAAVLADGRLAESRAAPRSATGPDLDHLALGGGGRLCVIAAAWIRLFPAAPAPAVSWRISSLAGAVEALARLCKDRLAPARARAAVLPEGGARLAAVWEGLRPAERERDRAVRALVRLGCTAEASEDALAFARGHVADAIEVDASWAALASLARASAADMNFVGLHAGGAFASLAVPGGPELAAASALEQGARILAPRRLRHEGPGWSEMGAGAAWARLVDALGAEEAPR